MQFWFFSLLAIERQRAVSSLLWPALAQWARQRGPRIRSHHQPCGNFIDVPILFNNDARASLPLHIAYDCTAPFPRHRPQPTTVTSTGQLRPQRLCARTIASPATNSGKPDAKISAGSRKPCSTRVGQVPRFSKTAMAPGMRPISQLFYLD